MVTLNHFHKWYDKNKHILSAKRKHRYQTDPEYKAKRLAYRRKYQPRETQLRRQKNAWKIASNGKVYKAYNLQEVFHCTGRTPGQIRRWERKGVIPLWIFPTAKRFYTMNQITMMYEVFCIRWRAGVKHLDNPKIKEQMAAHKLYMFVHWYD